MIFQFQLLGKVKKLDQLTSHYLNDLKWWHQKRRKPMPSMRKDIHDRYLLIDVWIQPEIFSQMLWQQDGKV